MDITGIPRSIPDPSPMEQFKKRLASMEAQLAEFRSSAQLRYGSISGGDGLVALDENGVARARFGPLTSVPGQYGVEVFTSNQWVPLASTAEGALSATDPSQLLVSAPAGQTVGWLDAGPDVTFTTYTGRITVILTANVTQEGYRASSYASYRLLSGGITQNTEQGIIVGNVVSAGMGGPKNSFAYSRNHQIAPGTYTLRMTYFGTSGLSEQGGGALNATYQSRTIIVIPN